MPDVKTLEAVTEDVMRIRLPLPLPDLREVNCYAILGTDGIMLIDPGWNDTASEEVLLGALADLGAAPSDVQQIFVTHSHWDHYTRALVWQQKYEIPVLLGDEERHTVHGFDISRGPYPHQADLLRKSGATELAARIDHLDIEEHERDQPFRPPDHWISDDQTFTCGSRTLRAIWTPGHTRGHTVFDLVDTPVLFTGDHLLPRITPSIGFEHVPEDSPLTSYLASLEKMLDDEGKQMMPAHGATMLPAAPRAAALIAHHRDRMTEIRTLLNSGATTSYEVAIRMTWTRHHRALHELSPLHAMTAVLEVRAHLEHMVLTGSLAKTTDSAEHYST